MVILAAGFPITPFVPNPCHDMRADPNLLAEPLASTVIQGVVHGPVSSNQRAAVLTLLSFRRRDQELVSMARRHGLNSSSGCCRQQGEQSSQALWHTAPLRLNQFLINLKRHGLVQYMYKLLVTPLHVNQFLIDLRRYGSLLPRMVKQFSVGLCFWGVVAVHVVLCIARIVDGCRRKT